MQTITIVENNRITGITYGTIEIHPKKIKTTPGNDIKNLNKQSKNKHLRKKHSNARANLKKSHQQINSYTNTIIGDTAITISSQQKYEFPAFVVLHFRKIRDKQRTKRKKNNQLRKTLLQNFNSFER